MEGTLLCFFYALSLLVAVKFLLMRTRKQYKNLPPSPTALPIIGHLYLLKQPIHRTLHNLSQRYGPIISLRFGSRFVIVVSSPSAVEECFTKNDITFANRPPLLVSKYLNYHSTTLVTANYGDHWRNLRRLSAIEIFSSIRLSMFLDIRREEVMMLLRRLYGVSSHGFAKVELRSMFMDLTYNIIMRMIARKRYYGEDTNGNEEAREFREIMQEFGECVALANPKDFIPILNLVDYDGLVKRMIRLSERTNLFLQRLIDEHRGDKDRNTMINHLLTMQESEPEYHTDEIIKGLILVMLLAGTKSSAVSLEWAFSNLLNNPHVLKKAKIELDTQVGQHQLINEPDFPKLRYLQNIISENFRLCPVTPLLVPHMSSEYCTLGGYDVPPNTMLFVNTWAIHRDPKVWDDATSFRPERFETAEDIKRAAASCKLIPFGLGRRACPGEGLANRVIALALGSLIQCFEWERVCQEKEIDMTEMAAVTMSKVEPLEVMCKARPILDMLLS